MTKQEKLEKAKTNHKYAVERINELEKEMTKLRMTLRDTRFQLYVASGKRKNPEPYDHHY